MAETLAASIEARFGLATAAGGERPAEGALATMLGHRTHRRFTERPVDDEMLELILACGFSAPTKSDLQQGSVVLVKDPARRRAIAELIPAMPWIATVAVFMVFCGDSRRIRRICELRGTPFANDHMDAFLNAVSDTAMVLQNCVTAAEALGLGCCPISHVRNHIDEVGRILELPEYVFPLAGLCVGHPVQAGWISLRLPPAVTVHTDRYDDTDFVAELDAYDRRRDARFSIPPEKQREQERFGTAAFYGWSEDKARQVAERERDTLRAYLERQGFDLS
jgi:nitroreductase/FMN reductase [NAD(P)H]